MPVERKEDFNIAISRDTGLASVQPTITTIERREEQRAHNKQDLIRDVENKRTKEQIKAASFLGGSVALAIGGIDYIIEGVDNQNLEQIAIGFGALVLTKYVFGNARSSYSESAFLSRQVSKIKRAK